MLFCLCQKCQQVAAFRFFKSSDTHPKKADVLSFCDVGFSVGCSGPWTCDVCNDEVREGANAVTCLVFVSPTLVLVELRAVMHHSGDAIACSLEIGSQFYMFWVRTDLTWTLRTSKRVGRCKHTIQPFYT
jgi:hypothetical protein